MRRRMNKVMAAMLIGAMTASLALTGCGGKKSASKDGKKELTVWAWDVALMQLEEAAEEYQKDHPDVTFKFEEMGTDQIYKKLSTSLATGNGIADIIAIEGDSFFGDTNIYEIFIENGKNVAEIPISPNAQEAGDSIGAAVSKIFLNGADVKSTMKDLEDELTTKFK